MRIDFVVVLASLASAASALLTLEDYTTIYDEGPL